MRPTLFFAAALMTLTGCAASNGILTVDSGPPVGKREHTDVYAVHVGERPNMSFSWKIGHCDYAIAHIEGSDYYEDCGPPLA